MPGLAITIHAKGVSHYLFLPDSQEVRFRNVQIPTIENIVRLTQVIAGENQAVLVSIHFTVEFIIGLHHEQSAHCKVLPHFYCVKRPWMEPYLNVIR